MATRGWKLRGYRPEASTVVSELRGRRSEPVKKGQMLESELRLCALYVTQSDMSLRALASINHIRLGNVKEILQGWGIDLKARTLLPWPLIQKEAEI
jgi:hypothetical protein